MTAGQHDFRGARLRTGEKRLQSQIGGGAARELLCRTAEETLTGAVGEAEVPLLVKGEDRRVDVLEDRPNQRRRLALSIRASRFSSSATSLMASFRDEPRARTE